MSQPFESLGHCRDRRARRLSRPAIEQHRHTKSAGSGDLAVSRISPAILGHDDVDGMRQEQLPIPRFSEGPTSQNVVCMRNGQRGLYGIYAAYEVAMLRSPRERTDVLPAKREEYVQRTVTQHTNGLVRIGYFGPAIAVYGPPCRPSQREHSHTRLFARQGRIDRNSGGVRMSCVDQPIDCRDPKILAQSLSAAESTSSYRHRLCERYGRATRERQGDREIGALGKARCKLPSLCRAAQNQNVSSHVGR